MIKNKALKTAIAAAKEHKQFTAIVTIAIVMTIVAFATECKAHGEEMHPAVTAKKAKVIKTEKPSSAKQASKPVIVKTTDNAREPISFDRDGHATRHDEMAPVMKLVVLPSEDELMDVKLATRREPTVEGHVVMRLVAKN